MMQLQNSTGNRRKRNAMTLYQGWTPEAEQKKAPEYGAGAYCKRVLAESEAAIDEACKSGAFNSKVLHDNSDRVHEANAMRFNIINAIQNGREEEAVQIWTDFCNAPPGS